MQEFFESWIFYIISVAIFAVGRYMDYLSSRYFRYYGGSERNKLWADDDGNYDVKKNTLWSIGIVVATLIMRFTPAYGGAFCIPLVWGLGAIAMSFINNARNAKERASQTNIFKALAREETFDPNLPALRDMYTARLVSRNKRTFYPKFRWLDIPEEKYPIGTYEGANAAHEDLRRQIFDTAHLPEPRWFPK